jgi:hypothetical protein
MYWKDLSNVSTRMRITTEYSTNMRYCVLDLKYSILGGKKGTIFIIVKNSVCDYCIH